MSRRISKLYKIDKESKRFAYTFYQALYTYFELDWEMCTVYNKPNVLK